MSPATPFLGPMWQCLQLGVPVAEIKPGSDLQWRQVQKTPLPKEACRVLGPVLPDALFPGQKWGSRGLPGFLGLFQMSKYP